MSLLHPRYWFSWLGIAVFFIVGQMPISVHKALSWLIGNLAYFIDAKHRRICAINLGMCFPELDMKAKKKLSRQSFCYVFFALLVMATVWFAPRKKTLARLLVTGEQNVHNALNAGRGVLLVVGHQPCLEAQALLGDTFPLSAVYRKHSNPVFELISYTGRGRYMEKIIARTDIKKVISEARKKQILLISPDQDVGRKGCVFSPFLGVMASTSTLIPRLQKMAEFDVLCCSAFIAEDNKYQLRISPPVEFGESQSVEERVDALNLLLEKQIREYPAQYLWQHKRFKTQPDGIASPYE